MPLIKLLVTPSSYLIPSSAGRVWASSPAYSFSTNFSSFSLFFIDLSPLSSGDLSA